MIKTLTKSDYDAIFALSQYAFQYELTAKELEEKKQEADRHIIWGWMSDDAIAAKLHLIPLACYINGKEFKMGGVSAVATWPEYRRQGAVKDLLYHALQFMRENGQTLSLLHPFAFSFYRKYGWELAFAEKHYNIPMEKLKQKWQGNGVIRRIGKDTTVLQRIYTEYAKKYNGPLVRDAKWWQERVLKKRWHVSVAYSDEGEAVGYIIYDVKDNTFNVHEIAYSTLNGRHLLLEFIANHDSMAETVQMVVPENDNLPLLVNEPRFEQKIIPYFMARIVDVKGFLSRYSFVQATMPVQLTLMVEDAFLPENTGVYQLNHDGAHTAVTFIKAASGKQEGIRCDVQTLASMFLGYKRPLELYDAGFTRGNKEDVEKLERLLPAGQTFLADFY